MRITRLSPITLASLALTILVFGAAAYTLSRSWRRRDQPVVTLDREAAPIEPPAAGSAPAAAPTPSAIALPPALPPALPISADVARPRAGPPAPTLEAQTVPAEPPVPETRDRVAIQNRRLLVASHNLQLVRQADERAFETLKLPEETRVAIRKIDEELGRKTHDDLGVNSEQVSQMSIDQQIGLGIARNDAAERDRRAAIKDLLGPEGATDFATAAYAEARRLRIQYRKQWAAELDSAAPWPAGLPRSPH
jgi:hypothetical protein